MVGHTVYIWGLLALFTVPAYSLKPYYGVYIGDLNSYAHNISGKLYAVDEYTLYLKDLFYDGRGPDAYFWVGKTNKPTPNGMIVPYPHHYQGSEPPVLGRFSGEGVILRLPSGIKLRDIKWLSIWCRRFTVNFGDAYIPPNLDPPRPRVLPEFKRFAHGLRSGNITILDSKTIYIPNLHYDGAGPAAYFWVGRGSEPGPDGIKVPDEEGSLAPLSAYEGEDIQIVLPGDMTVHDIGHLCLWCVDYRQNFGHVIIPPNLDVPPALGQTKITTTVKPTKEASGYSNCRELISDKSGRKMQVMWEMEDSGTVRIALSGRMKENQYMAFGPSAKQGSSEMVGSSVVVAYYNQDYNIATVQDYFMDSKAQCDGTNGVCPSPNNDAKVVKHSRNNGVTTVEFRRPTWPGFSGISTIIAAVGTLNSRKQPNYHYSLRTPKDANVVIDFRALNDDTCVGSLDQETRPEENLRPWPPAIIDGETTFRAVIGPTGGKRGYSVITGQPSWGICWFMNDLLIPEIYVERGKTYTFIVEGGNDPTNPARYHPLYITDSPEGGFGQKSEVEQRKQRVYAGVTYDADGYAMPNAAGRYCEWEHQTIDKSAQSETFEDYFKTLRLVCQDGMPAIMNWTVPLDAPKMLYYQCYTHSNLGWKIHVVDPGFRPRRDGLAGDSANGLTSVAVLITLPILGLVLLR